MQYHDIEEENNNLRLLETIMTEYANSGIFLTLELSFIEQEEAPITLYRIFNVEKVQVAKKIYRRDKKVLFSSTEKSEVILFLTNHKENLALIGKR